MACDSDIAFASVTAALRMHVEFCYGQFARCYVIINTRALCLIDSEDDSGITA